MNPEQVIKLLDAGFSVDEIRQMGIATNEPMPEPAAEPAPAAETAPAAEHQPAAEPAPGALDVSQLDTLFKNFNSGMQETLNNFLTAFQAANARNASIQSVPVMTYEDVVADFMGHNTNGGK